VPYDITLQCLDTFLDFVSNPPPAKYKIARDAIMLGMPFDASTDLGSMNLEAFGRSCLKIADCKDFTSLPPGFLAQAMKDADKNKNGNIDFSEFLYWYYKFSFSEEVLLGTEERKLRVAAREHNIPYDEIGKYKSMFDHTDTNKNGNIDYEEFKPLVAKLLKVPKGEEFPEKRCKDMWKAARGNSTYDNGLDFFTFVGVYKRYFMGDNVHDESPVETYYHNIRRVSMYDSNAFH
jgi:Ca2+-binding EF-hand superfamily protein